MFDLERAKAEIIQILSQQVQGRPWRDLPVVLERAESDLKVQLSRFLMEYILAELPTAKEVGRDRLSFRKSLLTLSVEPSSILTPDELAVAFLLSAAAADGVDLVQETVGINGIGRYRKLTVMVPPLLKHLCRKIAQIGVELISVYYEQLRQSLAHAAEATEREVAGALYGYIRQAFASKPMLPAAYLAYCHRQREGVLRARQRAYEGHAEARCPLR